MVLLQVTPPMERVLRDALAARGGAPGKRPSQSEREQERAASWKEKEEEVEEEQRVADLLQSYLDRGLVPHDFLAQHVLPSATGGESDLYQVTRHSRVVVGKAVGPVSSAQDALAREEVRARLRAIQQEAENRAYQEAARLVTRGSRSGASERGAGSYSTELREANAILSSVLNVLFSMAAVFVALWLVIPHSMTTDAGVVGAC